MRVRRRKSVRKVKAAVLKVKKVLPKKKQKPRKFSINSYEQNKPSIGWLFLCSSYLKNHLQLFQVGDGIRWLKVGLLIDMVHENRIHTGVDGLYHIRIMAVSKQNAVSTTCTALCIVVMKYFFFGLQTVTGF